MRKRYRTSTTTARSLAQRQPTMMRALPGSSSEEEAPLLLLGTKKKTKKKKDLRRTPHLPLKKRPFQEVVEEEEVEEGGFTAAAAMIQNDSHRSIEEEEEEGPPPTKLRRLVACVWSRSSDAIPWSQVTQGPPASLSGSYLYDQVFSEEEAGDDASWQRRVLQVNPAVFKRTKYHCDGVFLEKEVSYHSLSSSSSLPPLPIAEEEEEEAPIHSPSFASPFITMIPPLGPSRRTTAAYDVSRPPRTTTLRRTIPVPIAEHSSSLSFSSSTDTSDARRWDRAIVPPPLRPDEEEDDDDELLVLGGSTTRLAHTTSPRRAFFSSVTPSPHLWLSPHVPQAKNTPPLWRPGPVRHAFRPVVPRAATNNATSTEAKDTTWEHPLRWSPVTSAFAPGRRPAA